MSLRIDRTEAVSIVGVAVSLLLLVFFAWPLLFG